ncbi:4'-phosphopantetheinyl transferase superfamily protein [Rouxiella badensis]|uniref:4'-phosphopantetheinyl transferase family protein n=1 Tax=Rouxiella badensis TaxID=1646377 RepID=UPI0028D6D54D|nr:4'-phosphopantetheinyl transferase superfamily protein [Rouxiella badensis]
MMTPQKHATLDDFIVETEYGVIGDDADVRYLKVSFCTEAYREEDFARYAINKPDSLTRAVPKRKAEYLAGRYCCAALLRGFSVSSEVTTHQDRSPCWPQGMRGTISHGTVSDGYSQAMAIVTSCPQLCLGADIEVLNREVLREICETFTQPAEREYLQTLAIDLDFSLLLAFSAKESLFKALYPQVKTFFGFEYASVDSINTLNKTFVLRFNRDLNEVFTAGVKIKGSYAFDGKIIITIVVIDSLSPF